MTKQIPLGGKHGVGKFALVDDCDYERLKDYRWRFSGGYATSGDVARRELGHCLMHRVICQTPDDLLTDHINGNKLDNRRENLRSVNGSQNMMNTKIRRRNKVSKYKGVWLDAQACAWCASICVDYIQISLGQYKTQREAAIAYNEAAKQYHGEYASLNEIPDFDPDDKPVRKIRQHRTDTSSVYSGVSFHDGGWTVQIYHTKKNHRLGMYPSEKFAAMVYDAASIQHWGDDAIRYVNFPELIDQPLDLSKRFVFKATPKGSNSYAGVRRAKRWGRWFTRYPINGKHEFWRFDTAIETAEQYDKNMLLYDDHKAIYLNFPEKLDQYLAEIGPLAMPVQIVDESLL